MSRVLLSLSRSIKIMPYDIPSVKYNADNLIPVIVQDIATLRVLMLGYMNAEALAQTCSTGKVTFFSRSKNRIWVKGETSKNYLHVHSLSADCDLDTLLIKAHPDGPTCHTGADTCWAEKNTPSDLQFLTQLSDVIEQRSHGGEHNAKSYTSSLFARGINKIAQKVGEEAVELVIEAKDNDPDLFLGEAADLLFHYMVLLRAKNFSLTDVVKILKKRHQ